VRSDKGTPFRSSYCFATCIAQQIGRSTESSPRREGSRKLWETTRRQCSAHCKLRQKSYSAKHPSHCGSRFGDAGSSRSRPVSGQHRSRRTACGSGMRRDTRWQQSFTRSSVESRGARETAGRNCVVVLGGVTSEGEGGKQLQKVYPSATSALSRSRPMFPGARQPDPSSIVVMLVGLVAAVRRRFASTI
jgi:hypothetical protein